MSLIAHYPLNGDATDYFGNDGTSTNVTWVDGKIGQAGLFNGSSSKIHCYVESARNNVNASISCWMKPGVLESTAIITQQRSDDGPQHSRGLLMGNSSGEITAFSRNSAYSWNSLNSGVNAVVGVYSHVCLTQYLDHISLFVDGELRASMDMGSYVDSYNDFFAIGKYTDSGLFFDGQIDDLRIYDHALSEKEVINLYRANYLTSSLRTSSGINLPNVTVAESAPLTYDNGFIGDGSGRIVHTGHDAVFTELTVSAYFRLDQAGQNYVLDTNTSRDMIFKVDNDSTNTIQAGINGNYPKVNIGELIGREVHFVMTYDGAVQKIFADGIKVSESSTSGAVSLGELYIGGYYQYETYDFNGKIRDLQFFAREFSEAEVSSFSANAMSVDNIGNMHSKHLDESPKVRYIRDYLNGSTSNSGSHWIEIQANDTDGVNVALNADAYDEVGNPEPELTDGNTNTNPYVSGKTYMEVDLGSVFLLDNVHIWHYYFDGRTYYGTKTEVSVDGQNWITIFDNEVDGLYPETPSGKVHRVRSPSKFSVNYSGVSVGEASEVGVSRGLVSWLPLIGDTKDRVTNEVATNNGAIAVGDGYEFDGVDDWIDLGLNIDQGDTSKNYTIVLWFNKSADASNRNGIFGQDDGEYDFFIQENRYSSGDLIIAVGGAIRVEEPGAILANVWHFIAVVLSGNSVLYSKNGEPLIDIGASRSNYGPTTDNLSTGTIGGSTPTGEYFTGKIKGLKLYNTALTPEEVAQEYNSGKAFLTKNTAFAKEFIEV